MRCRSKCNDLPKPFKSVMATRHRGRVVNLHFFRTTFYLIVVQVRSIPESYLDVSRQAFYDFERSLFHGTEITTSLSGVRIWAHSRASSYVHFSGPSFGHSHCPLDSSFPSTPATVHLLPHTSSPIRVLGFTRRSALPCLLLVSIHSPLSLPVRIYIHI